MLWCLMVIYSQWTHSASSQHAQFHQSFAMNISPDPGACSAGLDAQGYSAHLLSDDTQETLTDLGNVDHLTSAIKKSWGHNGERKVWTENVSEGYQTLTQGFDNRSSVYRNISADYIQLTSRFYF